MAKVELDGLDELVQLVQSLGPKADRAENAALRAGGKVLKKGIEEQIRVKGLIDEGILLANITVSGVKSGDEGKYVDVGPNKKAFYGKFLEEGTSKMSAKPFIDPAVVATQRDVVKAMEAEIWKALGL